MADGRAVLRAHIQRLRELEDLPTTVGPTVARAMKRELARQVARGVGPDGKPWPKTNDGEQPLQGAAKAASIRYLDGVVVVRLDGHHARHHLGAVRGKVRRPIIPTDRIPDPFTRAIQVVVTGEFRRVMGV